MSLVYSIKKRNVKWYPTTHRFPWLMTDHTYWMSALNENIGYNQPTNVGYYLGSDLQSDEEAWNAAKDMMNSGTLDISSRGA